MKRYGFTVMLKDGTEVIKKYEEYHAHIWPEVKKALIDRGVRRSVIYRYGRQLFMLLEGDDNFDPKHSAEYLKTPRVKEWEELMATFQEPVSGAPDHAKWAHMKEVFFLEA